MKALILFEMSAALATDRYISEDLNNKLVSFKGCRFIIIIIIMFFCSIFMCLLYLRFGAGFVTGARDSGCIELLFTTTREM